jgi:hypothetical protein
MEKYGRVASTVAVLIIGLAIGATWTVVAARKNGVGAAGLIDAQELARLRKSADIVEIMTLQAQYSHAFAAGRLDEVADLNTETGGRGIYYQDPVTHHLHVTGHPVDLNGQPLKDFPGCIMFGRANVKSYLGGGGGPGTGLFKNSIRGRPDGPIHVITNMWVEVNGDTAKLRDYYADTKGMFTESDLVRTPNGWRFQFRHVIYPAPTDRTCVIAEPKFPIPPAGSLGGVPTFLDPL